MDHERKGPEEKPAGTLSESDRVVGLLAEFFITRTDQVAVLGKKGHPYPVRPLGSLTDVLRTHVLGDDAPEAAVRFVGKEGRQSAFKGRFRVGSYSTAADNSARWLCLDFDGPGHGNALGDPFAAAFSTKQAFVRQGLTPYLERSGGGNGWHLWVFFGEPLPASLARRLAFALVPDDIPLASGGFASAADGRGIEVFPKQDRLSKGKPGNMVWLPWWNDAAPEGNLFYRADEDGRLEVEAPETFLRVSRVDVERTVASVETAREPSRERTGKRQARRGDETPASASPDARSPWPDWRRRALAALDLRAVYGQWLTGKTKDDGWLECRDPSSPSGDRNPSAGVADGTGLAARGTFHSFISNDSLSVFDFLVEHLGASSFGDAARKIGDLVGIPPPSSDPQDFDLTDLAKPKVSGERPASRVPRPVIRVNHREFDDLLRESMFAVIRFNTTPQVFAREGSLVRLKKRGRSGLRVEAMTEIGIRKFLSRAARWVRTTSDAELDTFPPREVAQSILDEPPDELPQLDVIVRTPVVSESGEFITTPGFHPRDRLWYEPDRSLDVLPVPESPSPEEIAAARKLLVDDLLGDFPFVGRADRAHFVAALLLHFLLPLIDEPTPIHVLEAPKEGSGKGLLANLVNIIAAGAPASSRTIPSTDDEIRKMLTAELKTGRPVVLLDNVDPLKPLNSSSLASATTATTWTDRNLGASEMVELPIRVVWLLTGNNVSLSGEITRRCVRVRIDAGVRFPWRRDPRKFRHPQLVKWAKENRGRLVQALLTLIRAWICAGRPPFVDRSHASFESWSRVVGGVIDIAGIPGFLANVDDLVASADTAADELEEFVDAWWEAYGSRPRQVAELNNFCDTKNLMGSTRGDGGPRSQETRLGAALHRAKDQIFEPGRIVRVAGTGAHRGRACYAVHPQRNLGDEEAVSIPGIRNPRLPGGTEDLPSTSEAGSAADRESGLSEPCSSIDLAKLDSLYDD